MEMIIYPNLENPQKYKPPAFFLSLGATFSDIQFSCFLTHVLKQALRYLGWRLTNAYKVGE